MAGQHEEFTSIFKEAYANLCRFLEGLLGERRAAQDRLACPWYVDDQSSEEK
jgi:hypothetical protein